MKHHVYCFAVAVALLCLADRAAARVWTDSTGSYTVDADLIAFNEKSVVLQREDHELVAVPIEKLSVADQEYLKSKEAQQATAMTTGKMQTWTLRDSTNIVGRLVSYARHEITLQRRRGNIYVNDRQFENLPEVYQKIVSQVVAHFDKIERPDKEGLTAWLVHHKGQPRTFLVEGVVMEFENGDEYTIPFFLFSIEDLKVLRPGWDEWLAAHQQDDYDQRDDYEFRLQSLAAARQRDKQVNREIALMDLNLQAVQAGVMSLWEVTLYPGRGNAGPPLWVVMPGENSLQATNAALQQYPNYAAGPVRRVSN